MRSFGRTMPPHLRPANSVTRVMGQVLLALVPATVAYVWYFGPGILFNIAVAVGVAVAAEASMLAARGKPVATHLSDLSAIVTAVLLAFALPPLTPWWLTVTGTVFAIVFAKQLYGGLGYNPFNPAMAGYVVLLISFPAEMTRWLPPSGFGLALDQDYELGTVRYLAESSASEAGDVADAVLREGVDTDGGLFLQSTRYGSHVRTNKHWWLQAENLVGFMNAFQLHGDRIYWDTVKLSWDFIHTYVIDHVGGEWFTKVNRLGVPFLIEPEDDPSPYYRNDWKIDPWKCPYHNGRAMMELLSRIERILKI